MPDFFKEYATRRVRIYDGKVSEDKLIEKPAPVAGEKKRGWIPPVKIRTSRIRYGWVF